jgi:hypothetical protein
MIMGVVATARVLGTDPLTEFLFVNAANAEGRLIGAEYQAAPGDEGQMPELGGAIAWLNSLQTSSSSFSRKH